MHAFTAWSSTISDKIFNGLVGLTIFFVLLTVGLFFLSDNGRINAFPSYLLVLTVPLLIAFRRLPMGQLLNPVAFSATALLLYLAVSASWAVDGDGILKHLGYALLIGCFIAGFALCQQDRGDFLLLFLVTVLVCGTASAGISIYLHYLLPEYQPLPEPRLYGFGRLNNPVISAVSYGLVVMIGLHLLTQHRLLWQRAGLIASLAAVMFAISLTGTRVVWLAMGLAAGFGFSLYLRRNPLLIVSAALIITGGIAIAAIGWEAITVRALSFRPEIWAEFVGRAWEANILIGVGSGSDSYWVTEVLTFKHPHSIFVSTLYFGGLIGLALLLAMIGSCTRHLIAAPASRVRNLAITLSIYGLTVGCFDGDNPLTKIDYLWWVVWLPVALALCTNPPQAVSAEPSGSSQ
jgi:O-antigen ligase